MRRRPRPFVVYGFASTHGALAAESALKEAGVPVVPVPAPRELGSVCGIAMRVDPLDTGAAERALAAVGRMWSVRAEVMDV